MFHWWANPRGNAIRGRPVDGVEQAHSTRPREKNTGNFIGLNLETVAEITLQRTDTTHDLSSESREAINTNTTIQTPLTNAHAPHSHTHLQQSSNTTITHTKHQSSHTKTTSYTQPNILPRTPSTIKQHIANKQTLPLQHN